MKARLTFLTITATSFALTVGAVVTNPIRWYLGLG